jgi:hypothetical protein
MFLSDNAYQHVRGFEADLSQTLRHQIAQFFARQRGVNF